MQDAQNLLIVLAAGILIAAGFVFFRRLSIAELSDSKQPVRPLVHDVRSISASYQPWSVALTSLSKQLSVHLDAIEKEDHGRSAPPDCLRELAEAKLSQALPEQQCLKRASLVSPPPVVDALRVHAGRLVENIPRRMRIGILQQVEVRLAEKLDHTVLFDLEGEGDVHVHSLPVVETMSVELFSPSGAFTIDRRSELAQLVTKNVISSTLISNPAFVFARWQWTVTPLLQGSHVLTLRISARIVDSQGYPSSHTLVPDRDITVKVQVNSGRFLRNAL